MIADWGEKYKMRFAAHKTQAMLVTKRLKYVKPILRLNGHELAFQDNLRVLGLTIDRSLTFKPHLEHTYKKVVNIFKVMSRAVKTHWGLNPEILRLLYMVVIEPTVLYAAAAWVSGCGYQYNRTRLDQITRMFALKICRAHRTTSLTSSVLLAQILPLVLRVHEQAELYEIKRGKAVPGLPGRPLQKRVSPFHLPHPAKRREIKFGLINNQEECDGLGTDIPRLYTDGSKLEGKVGAAVSVWNNNKETRALKIKLADYCSVFQAEMAAILKALIYLQTTGSSGTIISDSRSALEALAHPGTENPIAFEIMEALDTLERRQLAVRFFWVRAHVGIIGNERADELAKEAALKMKTAPSYYSAPISFVKRILRQRTVEDWQAIYSAAETGNVTKAFFPRVEDAYKILRKCGITAIRTQIFSGHCGLKAYLHRFKLSPDPFCTCDDTTEETIFHILLECPKYGLRRFECECRMDLKLAKDNLPEIMLDNDRRPMLLAFAEPTLREAAKANGAKVI